MVSGFAAAWEPLKRYADFSGRSTRSDMLFFYVLTGAFNSLISWAALAVGFAAYQWISLAFTLALLSPWTGLAVRRLHDSGRSGWWLLLALPAFCAGLWNTYSFARDPFTPPPASALPPIVTILFGVTMLALIVLLLWKDDEETNSYGPNPRYDEPEPAA